MDYYNIFGKEESPNSELIVKKGFLSGVIYYSIFIPTFNRPEFLIEALNSAINQNFRNNFEIIVVDNSSDFDNFEIIKNYIDGLVLKKNISISLYRCNKHSNSWNMGMLKSVSDWVIMLHDDDLLHTSHLSSVHEKILLNNNIIVLCSDSYNLIQTNKLTTLNRIFLSAKEIIKKTKKMKLVRLNVFDFYFHNPASNTGVVLNRKIVLAQGGFNFSKDSPIPDYALFYRLTRDFNNTFYLNTKLSFIRFRLNDGLKKEVARKVKIKSEEIRKDILQNNPNYKYKDYLFGKISLKINNMEISDKLSFFDKYVLLFCLKLYTRIVSLFIFFKSLSS